MGFKDDVREKAEEFEADILNLGRRVGALERRVVELSARRAELPSARTTFHAAPSADTTASEERGAVDHGAIAFGLSEIKGKVAQIVPAGSESRMGREWEGVVDYFADVFAKADPGFDRAEFNRLALR